MTCLLGELIFSWTTQTRKSGFKKVKSHLILTLISPLIDLPEMTFLHQKKVQNELMLKRWEWKGLFAVSSIWISQQIVDKHNYNTHNRVFVSIYERWKGWIIKQKSSIGWYELQIVQLSNLKFLMFTLRPRYHPIPLFSRQFLLKISSNMYSVLTTSQSHLT